MHPLRLLSAPWVLPIASPPVTEGAIVLTADDAVLAVGRRADLVAQWSGIPEERAQGALLPGLVNAHTHLELSALAGRVSGGAGLCTWATAVAAESATLTPRQRQTAAVSAAHAAAAAGTSAVGDVGNGLVAVEAIEAAGLRGLFFHELLGSREARTGDAIADAEAERARLLAERVGLRNWPAGVGYVLAAHAPYSADPDLLRRIFATTARAEHPTSVHVAEDEDEIHLLRDGTGRWAPLLGRLGVAPGARTPGLGPVAYLAAMGAFEGPRPPLLVHMVHASAEDRTLARRHGAKVVLCPRSNLHIGGRLPDVSALLADGLAIALGTDSLASTPDLDLLAEVAVLAAQFPEVTPDVWLHAATAGGAHALGRGELGALAPGKRPGVLDVAVEDPSAPVPSLVRVPHPRLRWMARA